MEGEVGRSIPFTRDRRFRMQTRRATRLFEIPSQFRFVSSTLVALIPLEIFASVASRVHCACRVKVSWSIDVDRNRRTSRPTQNTWGIYFDVSVLSRNKLDKNTHLVCYAEVNRIERRYTCFQRITLSLSLTSNNDRLSCRSAHKATSIFDVRRRYFLGGTGRTGLPFPTKVSFRSHTWPHLRPRTFSREISPSFCRKN